jgi:hypothetical protein
MEEGEHFRFFLLAIGLVDADDVEVVEFHEVVMFRSVGLFVFGGGLEEAQEKTGGYYGVAFLVQQHVYHALHAAGQFVLG